jgi:hypothetical protein
MTPIPADKLPAMVGQPIHLAWANKGCVWILEAIDGNVMRLRTPKTKRPRTAHVNNACYVRRLDPTEPQP